MTKKEKAIQWIEEDGALLVFPIKNQSAPRSLWSRFYPRSEMRWEWDSDGDRRVSDLWILREELSRSDEVIYAKWYKGRATFFSKSVFKNLRAVSLAEGPERTLSETSRSLLDQLVENSPISTKTLKALADLRGKDNESLFTRSMKELWERLLIVGYGEFDDGAFPSLGLAAATSIFEELCRDSETILPETAERELLTKLGPESPFLKKLYKPLQSSGVGREGKVSSYRRDLGNK